MIEIVINGVRTEIEGDKEQPLGGVLKNVRTGMSNEQTLISSLRVNGQELTDVTEELLASQPVSVVGPIEVETASKNQIAHETIDALLTFLPELMVLAQRTAVSPNKGERVQIFNRLLNGIETFYEAVSAVKLTYRIPENENLALLEGSLISIMDRLLVACEERNDQRLNAILEGDLADNFRLWMSTGIPSVLNTIDQ